MKETEYAHSLRSLRPSPDCLNSPSRRTSTRSCCTRRSTLVFCQVWAGRALAVGLVWVVAVRAAAVPAGLVAVAVLVQGQVVREVAAAPRRRSP